MGRLLVFIAVQRLDSESVKAWEHNLGSLKEPPTWKQFSEFLITRLLSLQAFEKSRIGKPPFYQSSAKSHFESKIKDNTSHKTNDCSICSSNHYVANCPQHTSKSVQQRLALITKHKLCFNCLGPHRSSACRITKRCLKCGHKHHTTIYQTKPVSSNSNSDKSNESPLTSSKPAETHILHSSTKTQVVASPVLLATDQVTIVSHLGEKANARALIDQGSEISLISERLVQLLRFPRRKSFISLVGIGAQKSRRTKGLTTFLLRSHFDQESEIEVSAHILPKLTNSIPSVQLEERTWPQLQGLQLADENFLSPGPIDIILGAEVYAQIIENGVKKGKNNSPVAQRTKIGWIISGPHGSASSSEGLNCYHVSQNNDLYELLQRFWKLEEIPSMKTSSLSLEEQECEQHFSSTHTRDDKGRYIVRLPFKYPVSKLEESRTKALRILANLTRKLKNDPNFFNSYSAFLKEYQRLDHMTPVLDSEQEPLYSYYLPHHGIIRANSRTTKLRVVFNGSSDTTTGLSLNDVLHTGAKLQIDLFNVLVWFRQFRYVFSSDVEKMYRQIKVHPADQVFQRILWHDHSDKIITYQLTTVTYELGCAPFLALRAFKQLITDEGAKFPLAAPVLRKGRYVDDVFGGGDSIQQTQQIVKQLNQLCMAGGFPLQKWASNHPAILESVPSEKRIGSFSVRIEDTTVIHTLGLGWKPFTDSFHFTTSLPPISVITKRTILSTIAKLFDPLGFISPVIITAKIFIQELWSNKLGWDDPLPQHLSSTWTQFIEQLPELSQLTVPRWLGLQADVTAELHGFCDVSQLAIAAVVYIRYTTPKGETHSSFVCSKTKVAPLKKLTIPRLELFGAVNLTKLIAQLLPALEMKSVPIYMWTDSAITHTWVNGHPSRWKDFVHNRVCFIQETLLQAAWRFVPGTDNPADYATRGLTPLNLSTQTQWWLGPRWLQQDSSKWL